MASIVLIPNAIGDETAQAGVVGATAHWQACVSHDGNTSYTYENGNIFKRDLFNLEEPIIPDDATISKVVARAYVAGEVAGAGVAQTSIKTNGVVYDGAAQDVPTSYALIETEYATNPQTGLAWTKAELQTLQAGSVLKRPAVQKQTRCTYVLVIAFFDIGSQTFFPIDPVEVTPGTASAWVDVDVSAYVPEGATGVILHIVSTGGSFNAAYIAVRKNGSTDNRYAANFFEYTHAWAAIGVDANRIFEAYIYYTAYHDIYLVGYTMFGVTFFTNAYDKSLATTAAWLDIDCATEAPSAVGLVFEVYSTTGINQPIGMRKNGSTDNRYNITGYCNTKGIIIGCDTSQICEGYIGNTKQGFFLVGYITDGAVFNTNATDVSLDTTGSWLDLTALPANSVMGFIEVASAFAGPYSYGLRKDGSAEDIYWGAKYHPWAFVECDADRIIEGKIANVAIDFFVVGYAAAGGVTY